VECNKKNHLVFYSNIFLDAIAPQNFLTINPELIYSTVEHVGKNLFNCIERFLTDLINNHGYFQVKTTDFTAFTVGKNLATTSGKVIFKNDLMELIRYTPATNTVYQAPLLFIPPFINKYYI
jgi:polyhydroxyalkanoate synthase